MRRHLGIEPGRAVIMEECAGKLRFTPSAVLEVELYSNDQIAAWTILPASGVTRNCPVAMGGPVCDLVWSTTTKPHTDHDPCP